jgi:hypothetical protein
VSVTQISEEWMNKREIASFFTISVRTIERCMAQEMPHSHIFGKAAFKPTQVEPWLEQHGYLERKGEAA